MPLRPAVVVDVSIDFSDVAVVYAVASAPGVGECTHHFDSPELVVASKRVHFGGLVSRCTQRLRKPERVGKEGQLEQL